MIAIVVLIKNWWRVELLYNPVEVAVINANQVTLYSTSWCPYCRKVREYFAEADIPYRDYDIEEDARANRRYEQLGVVGVPALVIGDRVIQGYDVEAIRAALDKLGTNPGVYKPPPPNDRDERARSESFIQTIGL